MPDPNTFGGAVKIKRPDDENWSEVTLTHGYTENSRGIGPSDMAAALAEDRPHRANGELAYHVLDVMHAFHDSSDKGKFVTLKSTCKKPEALKSGLLS